MARDGEATRKRVIEQTAGLLNKQGYLGTPVSEIMRVTGLQKGGIYNHFESRQSLALEAFEYAVGRLHKQLHEAVTGKPNAREKLLAMLKVFRGYLQNRMLPGGCPIMNLAIESDDADPKMRDAARKAMAEIIEMFEKVIAQGIEAGDFRRGDLHVRTRASLLIASIEGGIMLSNLYKEDTPLKAVLTHIEEQVRQGLR